MTTEPAGMVIVNILRDLGGEATWNEIERHPLQEDIDEHMWMSIVNSAFGSNLITITTRGTKVKLK